MVFTDESVKRQITDSISENLTDSDLESTNFQVLTSKPLHIYVGIKFNNSINYLEMDSVQLKL